MCSVKQGDLVNKHQAPFSKKNKYIFDKKIKIIRNMDKINY